MLNIEYLKELHKRRTELAIAKNNDYSSGHIDAIKTSGIPGIAVRLIDKVARLDSLILSNNKQLVSESIRDTLVDIANYADYACMLLDNEWT